MENNENINNISEETNVNNNLTTCKACGALVSKKAPNCPKCGNPIKKKRKGLGCAIGCLTPFLLIFLLIVGINISTNINEHKQAKKYDKMATFILENGVENNGKYSIEKNLSELGDVWKDENTIVTLSYEKSTGQIIMEEITKYDDCIAYYKAVCYKNKDEVNVLTNSKYKDYENYHKGYVLKSSFYDANKETAVYGFETNSAPFGEANAKATLGVSSYLLFSHTAFLIRNVGCPVSLSDIGFKIF